MIWVTAAGIVLGSLTGWFMFVAYASGYATGNYVGIWLECKLAMGMELVRIISSEPSVALAKRLRQAAAGSHPRDPVHRAQRASRFAT